MSKELEAKGEEIAHALHLKRDKEHKDRWVTDWGSKTSLGLYLTLQRMMGAPSNKYTVLLMRPDYLASNYGEDTCMIKVEAASVAEAQEKAQREVCIADDPAAIAQPDDELKEQAGNYAVICVIAGHHNDIKE